MFTHNDDIPLSEIGTGRALNISLICYDLVDLVETTTIWISSPLYQYLFTWQWTSVLGFFLPGLHQSAPHCDTVLEIT